MTHPEKPTLDDAITDILATMSLLTPGTDQYASCVAQLTTLTQIKDGNAPDRVSRDTIALAVANLLGIGIIVGYERMNVVTSKALTLLTKVRP